AYFTLLEALGNEFSLLLDAPLEAIAAAGSPEIAAGIARMRSGEVNIVPGFDGEFGKIRLFGEVKKPESKGRTSFF
ncbi:MAG: DNA helicase UvrD, partial [Nitrospirales bacterium]|nr:DNA helicase UvrD [Nitrospirales bacterium]